MDSAGRQLARQHVQGRARPQRAEGTIGIRAEDVPPGAGEGFSIDPGKFMQAPVLGDSDLIKCDLRLKIAVTGAQPQTAESRLTSQGMFSIDSSGDSPVLIHRSRENAIIRTAIKKTGGQYSINRPSWPAISGRRFDSLGKLTDALKLMGMQPVEQTGN